ncbi:hypothetical protein A4G99_14300 [Haladaptatus sp. R4]|nr:hypothetical protein A4G99_14300 [Haladaptatus sp. R4]
MSIRRDPDRQTRLRDGLTAVGLFLCSAGFLAVIARFDPPVFRFLRLEYFAVGLLTGSAVLARYDRNLRRVWLFNFAFAAGFGIHLVGMGITGEMPGLPFRILWAITVGLVIAAILGTLGGVLGLGVSRLVASIR